MEAKAFGNVRDQIGFCGIWCGSCAVGNGTLKQLAKRCEHIIGGYGVDQWGAKDFDGKELMKGLASIQHLPVCRGCLKGGGNEACKIRPCASGKKLLDCMECSEKNACSNSEALERVRSGALRVGMLARTEQDNNRRELLKEWTAGVKDKCQDCGA